MTDINVQYEIERGIEIPVGRPPRAQINLAKMEVGDSVMFPRDRRASVATYASRLKKQGKKFTVRKVDDDNCRVWRVE